MELELVEQKGDIAQAINDEYALMTGDMTRAVQRAIHIGELLTQAKSEVAHGEWIPWVEKNLVFGRVQAAKYMRISANVHSGVHLIDQARTINQAVEILSEPKDDSSVEPKLDEEEPSVEYVRDPDQEEQLQAAARRAAAAEVKLTEAEQKLKSLNEAYNRADKTLAEQKEELKRLRKLDDDKQKIEQTLADIQELEKRKTDLYQDAESTHVVHSVLVKSREFFTRECMQIPALKLRKESVKIMRRDFEGLVDLVENWIEAIKSRFLEEGIDE